MKNLIDIHVRRKVIYYLTPRFLYECQELVEGNYHALAKMVFDDLDERINQFG